MVSLEIQPTFVFASIPLTNIWTTIVGCLVQKLLFWSALALLESGPRLDLYF